MKGITLIWLFVAVMAIVLLLIMIFKVTQSNQQAMPYLQGLIDLWNSGTSVR